jgi:hypothetical protein
MVDSSLLVPADKIQGNPDSLGSGCVKQELGLGDSKAWLVFFLIVIFD